ncbi:MAG TPA: hypothetical protein DCG33_07655 [Prevotellaceae bacterium]|nr:hypothetical protein [Prevotellaceae bacterium]
MATLFIYLSCKSNIGKIFFLLINALFHGLECKFHVMVCSFHWPELTFHRLEGKTICEKIFFLSVCRTSGSGWQMIVRPIF